MVISNLFETRLTLNQGFKVEIAKNPQDKMSEKNTTVKRGLNLNLKLKINFCLDFRSREKVSSRVLDHFLFRHIEFNNL